MPVTESLLRKTAMLIRSPPPDVSLRAGDAIHTATALETGERRKSGPTIVICSRWSPISASPGAVLERFATIR